MEGAFLLLVLVGLGFYLLPTVIAFSRGHHSKVAIAALNILLGWSLLGWVGALVWSLTAKRLPAAA